MIRLRTKATFTPIGLDLGSHSFKAVQLQPAAGGKREVIAVAVPRTKPGVPITPDEILRLQGALDRRGFVGREVVLAVPSEAVTTSILELPARAPGLPMEQLATAEFSRVARLEAAAISLSCWDLPATARANRATYMMAVGAPTQRLDAQVELVESGMLRVVAIDDPFSAMARGATHDLDKAGCMHAVLDLGYDAARLSLVHGTTLAYTRRFADAAVSKLIKNIVEATGADAADVQRELSDIAAADVPSDSGFIDFVRGHFNPLWKDVAQTLSYGEHQYPDTPLRGLRLCGGGATLPGVAKHLTQTLNIQCLPSGQMGVAAIETLALGLCLWEGQA